MSMVWEKIVVTAKEFIEEKEFKKCSQLTEPFYQSKVSDFGWNLKFGIASIFCEICWKIGLTADSISEYNKLDRLFSPSPIATHANFRGARGQYKTGDLPEAGALAIWRRGSSWQGAMGIVSKVSPDRKSFDIIEARVRDNGDDDNEIIVMESYGKKVGLDCKSDKLNLIGFVYPPRREI